MFPKNCKLSKAQREHQRRFRQAVAYATTAQTNPICAALGKNQPAYTVALAAARHPPG
jgi:hypothetical protein